MSSRERQNKGKQNKKMRNHKPKQLKEQSSSNNLLKEHTSDL